MNATLAAAAKIEGLYIKRHRGGSSAAVAAMHCVAGSGVAGDVHANRLSPRQVLVTRAGELSDLRIAPGALGENIVISCDHPGLFRPGSAIVGVSGVEIRLTMFCEPCKRIAHLGHDLSSLLHRRGVLGVFASGGELKVGEAVELIGGRYRPLPESPYRKFLDFLPTIPRGRLVRYADVAIAIGAADSFVRALPGYIRRSAGQGLPVHRIVNARGQLLDFMSDQAGKLRCEGLVIRDGAVPDLASYLWDGDYSGDAGQTFDVAGASAWRWPG